MFDKQSAYVRMITHQAGALGLGALAIITAGMLMRNARYFGKSLFPAITVVSLLTTLGAIGYVRTKWGRNLRVLEMELDLIEREKVRSDQDRKQAFAYLQKIADKDLVNSALQVAQKQDIQSWYNLAKRYVISETINAGMTLNEFINGLLTFVN